MGGGGGGGGGGAESRDRVSYKKGGGDHLAPPHLPRNSAYYQCSDRTPLEKFLNRCKPFCCNSCHFAAVYALKPPPFIILDCADLKGGGYVAVWPFACCIHNLYQPSHP